LGRRPLGAILHSSNEPGELSQWLCHDDSTINIVVLIIIIIINHWHFRAYPVCLWTQVLAAAALEDSFSRWGKETLWKPLYATQRADAVVPFWQKIAKFIAYIIRPTLPVFNASKTANFGDFGRAVSPHFKSDNGEIWREGTYLRHPPRP